MPERAGEGEYVPLLLDPRYDPINDVMVACAVCGSAVALNGRRAHADWHDSLRDAAQAPLRRLATLAEKLGLGGSDA